jgi:hypothetical protein
MLDRDDWVLLVLTLDCEFSYATEEPFFISGHPLASALQLAGLGRSLQNILS